MRIDFHPEAVDELNASLEWYAERSESVGLKFAHTLDAAIEKIVANPERFLKVTKDHRACSVQGFPFQVIYCYRPNRILVVAIAHAKRRPNYWKNREQ